LTDISDDTLRLVRAAEVQAMYRDQKGDYLRRYGWRMLNARKQQRWESANGVKATLAGACHIQAMADLEET
jgi:hypothetical protein